MQRRFEAVESAAGANRVSQRKLAYELDRLAEHLIGETAPELQPYKHRIQILAVRIDPTKYTSADVEIYIETYCRHR